MSLNDILHINNKTIHVNLFADARESITGHTYFSYVSQREELYKIHPHLMTDKYYVHSYIPVYDKLFKNVKNDKLNILEIGISHGGSLNLWNQFFTNSTIHGIDIEKSPTWLINHDEIKVAQTDAYSKNALTLFDNVTYDIIIDDGPHTLESMIIAVELYLNKVNKGGMLIIEDIISMTWIQSILNKIPNNIIYTKEIYDLRHIKNRDDDIMLVLYVK